MNLLLDANISWRLKKLLENHFTKIIHADDLPFTQPVSDTQVWNYAKENDCLIVTNDEDYFNLSVLFSFPPKVILLKTGNQKTLQISSLLIKHIADIEQLITSEEYGILEIY